jgi:hypothetical protein
VREIPHHECAGRVRAPRHGLHVVQAAGAVVHLREHQHRGAFVDRCGQVVGLHEHQLRAPLARQAVGDVEIGREVRALGDDAQARGRVGAGNGQRGAQHLEEVDGRGVRHQELARAGADQAADLVPHALRQRDPPGGVPALDQLAAPFVLDHGPQPRHRRFRQHAERVAVEVHDARRQLELVAQRAQRILRVERDAVVAIHRRLLSTARTGDASAVTSFNGRAISS